MGRKSTKAEMELRIETVAQMLIQGTSRTGILEYAKQNWGVCRATVDELIKRASLRIIETSKADTAFERGRALTRYNEIYRAAGEKGLLKVQIAAQTRLDEINGLTSRSPTALAISNVERGQGGMTPEDEARVRKVVQTTMQSARQEQEEWRARTAAGS